MDLFDESCSIEDVIKRLDDLARNGNYVFRGYGKQDQLFPNILREQKSLINLEKQLLTDFEKFGSNYFHATTPIDFMSYAQHFGIPTRLLDFTHNPYIALSFSLYNPKSSKYKHDEDRDYYYVRYASLKDNLVVNSIALKDDIYNNKYTRTDSLGVKACQCIDSVTDLFGKNFLNRNIQSLSTPLDSLENAEDKIRRRVILFVDSNQSNQRIIMQQGLFMFPYTLDKEEHRKILSDNSKCIKVHKIFRDGLIQYLDILGYNTFRLMPDLTSICDAIKRRNIDGFNATKYTIG